MPNWGVWFDAAGRDRFGEHGVDEKTTCLGGLGRSALACGVEGVEPEGGDFLVFLEKNGCEGLGVAAGWVGAFERAAGSTWFCFDARIRLICSPILARAAGSSPPYFIDTKKFFRRLPRAVDVFADAFPEAFGGGGEPSVPVLGLNLISFFALLSEPGFEFSVGVSFGAVVGIPAADWGRDRVAGGGWPAAVFSVVDEAGMVPS